MTDYKCDHEFYARKYTRMRFFIHWVAQALGYRVIGITY